MFFWSSYLIYGVLDILNLLEQWLSYYIGIWQSKFPRVRHYPRKFSVSYTDILATDTDILSDVKAIWCWKEGKLVLRRRQFGVGKKASWNRKEGNLVLERRQVGIGKKAIWCCEEGKLVLERRQFGVGKKQVGVGQPLNSPLDLPLDSNVSLYRDQTVSMSWSRCHRVTVTAVKASWSPLSRWTIDDRAGHHRNPQQNNSHIRVM